MLNFTLHSLQYNLQFSAAFSMPASSSWLSNERLAISNHDGIFIPPFNVTGIMDLYRKGIKEIQLQMFYNKAKLKNSFVSKLPCVLLLLCDLASSFFLFFTFLLLLFFLEENGRNEQSPYHFQFAVRKTPDMINKRDMTQIFAFLHFIFVNNNFIQ